jgi:hypothetical protein
VFTTLLYKLALLARGRKCLSQPHFFMAMEFHQPWHGECVVILAVLIAKRETFSRANRPVSEWGQ